MSIYYSMLTLTPWHFKTLKLTDAYSLHRIVYSLFDKELKQATRILYTDLGGDFTGRKVAILSSVKPESPLIDNRFFETRLLTDKFFSYPSYRFGVTVNPVKRKENVEVPITCKREVTEWFSRKSKGWGFEIEEASIDVSSLSSLQFDGRDGHHITVCQAKISGVLKVTDPEKFKSSARNGIGRGKAFGCGLLQLQPISLS